MFITLSRNIRFLSTPTPLSPGKHSFNVDQSQFKINFGKNPIDENPNVLREIDGGVDASSIILPDLSITQLMSNQIPQSLGQFLKLLPTEKSGNLPWIYQNQLFQIACESFDDQPIDPSSHPVLGPLFRSNQQNQVVHSSQFSLFDKYPFRLETLPEDQKRQLLGFIQEYGLAKEENDINIQDSVSDMISSLSMSTETYQPWFLEMNLTLDQQVAESSIGPILDTCTTYINSQNPERALPLLQQTALVRSKLYQQEFDISSYAQDDEGDFVTQMFAETELGPDFDPQKPNYDPKNKVPTTPNQGIHQKYWDPDIDFSPLGRHHYLVLDATKRMADAYLACGNPLMAQKYYLWTHQSLTHLTRLLNVNSTWIEYENATRPLKQAKLLEKFIENKRLRNSKGLPSDSSKVSPESPLYVAYGLPVFDYDSLNPEDQEFLEIYLESKNFTDLNKMFSSFVTDSFALEQMYLVGARATQLSLEIVSQIALILYNQSKNAVSLLSEKKQKQKRIGGVLLRNDTNQKSETSPLQPYVEYIENLYSNDPVLSPTQENTLKNATLKYYRYGFAVISDAVDSLSKHQKHFASQRNMAHDSAVSEVENKSSQEKLAATMEFGDFITQLSQSCDSIILQFLVGKLSLTNDFTPKLYKWLIQDNPESKQSAQLIIDDIIKLHHDQITKHIESISKSVYQRINTLEHNLFTASQIGFYKRGPNIDMSSKNRSPHLDFSRKDFLSRKAESAYQESQKAFNQPDPEFEILKAKMKSIPKDLENLENLENLDKDSSHFFQDWNPEIDDSVSLSMETLKSQLQSQDVFDSKKKLPIDLDFENLKHTSHVGLTTTLYDQFGPESVDSTKSRDKLLSQITGVDPHAEDVFFNQDMKSLISNVKRVVSVIHPEDDENKEINPIPNNVEFNPWNDAAFTLKVVPNSVDQKMFDPAFKFKLRQPLMHIFNQLKITSFFNTKIHEIAFDPVENEFTQGYVQGQSRKNSTNLPNLLPQGTQLQHEMLLLLSQAIEPLRMLQSAQVILLLNQILFKTQYNLVQPLPINEIFESQFYRLFQLYLTLHPPVLGAKGPETILSNRAKNPFPLVPPDLVIQNQDQIDEYFENNPILEDSDIQNTFFTITVLDGINSVTHDSDSFALQAGDLVKNLLKVCPELKQHVSQEFPQYL